MSAIINGVPVSFGFPTTSGGLTVTGTVAGTIDTSALFGGKFLLQQADFEHGAKEEMIADEVGNSVTRVWFDPMKKGTLEWIPKGANLAAALAASNISTVTMGNFLIISECAAIPGLVATWQITNLKTTRTNTNAAKLSFSLEHHAGIITRAT